MKKTYLIKDQGKGLVENLTPDKLFDIASGGLSNETDPNSGGSGLIEVTYDELVNLKNTSKLKKGQSYLLTDYITTYTQPVTGVTKTSGVIEPLILTAVSENQISNICRSTLYPQDIVFYEITGDIGNGYGTEGFTKGKIYRRIDTLRNNDIGTDWRHIKYDRNGVDKLLFEDDGYCYSNVIKTYYLFNNVVGNNFNNNTIGNYFHDNTIGNEFNVNTIQGYFRYNTIGNYFFSNTIDSNFNNNTIGSNFNNNTIGLRFEYNTIGYDFNNNRVGVYFQSNGNQTTPFLSKNTEFRNSINNATSSTEIQNQFIDVVVFKSPNGTKKQRYYDNSNNLVINNL